MKLIRLGKHVSRSLSAYCHDELSLAERQRVEVHLGQCTRCRQELDAIKFGIKLAEQASTVAAPETLWASVSENIEEKQETFTLWLNWKFALSFTAVLLLLVGGWFVFTKREKSAPQFAAGAKPSPTLLASPPVKEVVASLPPATPAPTAHPNARKKPVNTWLDPREKNSQAGEIAWEVDRVMGAPQIGNEKIGERGKLGVGEYLETDNDSAAKVKVAEIGYLDVDPNSRLRLVQTKQTQHRIALEKGKLSALILAPPRLFIVDTPSATAVDMGCAYTLEVDEAGDSFLQVTLGWVSFVRNGRESYIPAGAMCVTRKGKGVGTPYFADASEAFKSALNKLDFEQNIKYSHEVTSLLSLARQEDRLTLWHLLGRQYAGATAEIRGQIYDSLVKLAPPPAGVTRDGIIKGNQKMLDLWWEEKIR